MLWDPFFTNRLLSPRRAARGLHDQIGRLFEGAWGDALAPRNAPPMNAVQDEQGLVLSFALPGVDPDGVELSIENDELTIASRAHDEDAPEGRAHRLERRSGGFSRTVKLPFAVETAGGEAHFRHGVLEIRLPRAEKDAPLRIPVQTDDRGETR